MGAGGFPQPLCAPRCSPTVICAGWEQLLKGGTCLSLLTWPSDDTGMVGGPEVLLPHSRHRLQEAAVLGAGLGQGQWGMQVLPSNACSPLASGGHLAGSRKGASVGRRKLLEAAAVPS